MLEIIKSLFGFGKIDAMLLKARQAKIESMVKSMGTIKDIGMWFVNWLAKLWTMIQIYVFGCTDQELTNVLGYLKQDKVVEWITEVDNFQLQQIGAGRLDSFSAQVAGDEEVQNRLYELRSRGLEIEKIMSQVKGVTDNKLFQVVQKNNTKINKWVNAIEVSLARSKPKHSPLVLYFHGDPGVGKSEAVRHFAATLYHAKKEEFNWERDCFQKSRSEEAWDGYRNHKMIMLDDFLQTKHDETNIVELGTFIDMASRNPCHLKMATCESKSGVYCTSDLIVLTSNCKPTPELISTKIQSFGAFARRIDFCVEVRRKYAHRPGPFDKKGYEFDVYRWFPSSYDRTTDGSFNCTHMGMSWNALAAYCVLYWSKKEKQETELDKLQTSEESDVFFQQLYDLAQKSGSSTDEIFNCYEQTRDGSFQLRKEKIIAVNSKQGPVAQAGEDEEEEIQLPHPKKTEDFELSFEDAVEGQIPDQGTPEYTEYCKTNVKEFRRCAVFGCKFGVKCEDPERRMFAYLCHNVMMSIFTTPQGMAHRAQAKLIRRLVPSPRVNVSHIAVVSPSVYEELKKIQGVFPNPTAHGSPWTVEEMLDAGWVSGAEYLIKQIALDERVAKPGWFDRLLCPFYGIQWPWSGPLKKVELGINAHEEAVGRIADAAEETKKIVKDAITEWMLVKRAISKLFYIGTMITIAGTAISFIVKWLRNIPFRSIFSSRKSKQVTFAEEAEEEAGPRGKNISGDVMTVRKRNRRKIVRIESDKPLVVASAPIMPKSDSLEFRKPEPGEEPNANWIYVTAEKKTLEITNFLGLKKTYELKDWKIESRELGKRIAEYVQETQAESIEDRMELVEKVLNEGPAMEASSDPVASQAIQTLSSNLAIVRLPETGRKVSGVFVCGRILMCPLHILSGCKDSSKAILSITTSKYARQDVDLSKEWSMKVKGKDVLLVEVPNTIPAYTNIIPKFIRETDSDWGDASGYIIVPVAETVNDKLSTRIEKQVRNITTLDSQSYQSGEDKIIIAKAMSYESDTLAGECGSLIVRFNSRLPQKFLGFHVAGDQAIGYGTIITQESLNKWLAVRASAQSAVEVYPEGDVVNQSLFSLNPITRMSLIGCVSKKEAPSAPRKSKIRPSPIQGMLASPRTKPAHLRPFVNEDGQVIDPLVKALGKLECDQIILPPDVIRACADVMRIKYSKMTVMYKGSRGLLNNDEMINGIEGDTWIRPLNMHTSPGYPYVLAGGKHLYLLGDDKKIMSPLLERQFRIRENMAKDGLPVQSIVIDCLKDERLPNAKVDIGKTRIFSNCPLDLNLLMRKYFLRFLAHMMDHHVDGEVSVGINVHSGDWECLFKRLRSKGDHWIAGDYEAWDKRTPYQLAVALLPLVEDYYKRFDDYDEEHAVLRRVLIEQVFTSTRMAIGEQAVLYRVHQSMPSGIPLTAVYNSLINSLLFRVVFTMLAMEQGKLLSTAANAYDKHVSFAAYGDDHIVRVSEPVFEWFNMRAIARKMKEYGIGYTAPDKSEYMPEELMDDQLTYLKRKFRVTSGRIDAPLPVEGIIDILSWVHGEDRYEVNEAMKMAVQSVFLELSHHPEDVYNEWYHKILVACTKKGIEVPMCLYRDALLIRQSNEMDFEISDF
uniref:Polyprotein n=1 Tax=Crocidura lasiura picornavirus 1 TaxID=3139480 RepID=A0AB38ZJQ9_9VIRU